LRIRAAAEGLRSPNWPRPRIYSRACSARSPRPRPKNQRRGKPRGPPKKEGRRRGAIDPDGQGSSDFAASEAKPAATAEKRPTRRRPPKPAARAIKREAANGAFVRRRGLDRCTGQGLGAEAQNRSRQPPDKCPGRHPRRPQRAAGRCCSQAPAKTTGARLTGRKAPRRSAGNFDNRVGKGLP